MGPAHSDLMPYFCSIKFHGDLILSRAAVEETILLWKIDGFDSSKPVPSPPPTDISVGQLTRSAFGKGFQRLMQFNIDGTWLHWMRFGLFNAPGMHPILAMGNIKGGVFFWDLQKLEKSIDGVSSRSVPHHGSIKATSTPKGHSTDDCVRAISWSPGGEWCVIGGNNGMLRLCSRWGGKILKSGHNASS
jgi:polycomb protein EED